MPLVQLNFSLQCTNIYFWEMTIRHFFKLYFVAEMIKLKCKSLSLIYSVTYILLFQPFQPFKFYTSTVTKIWWQLLLRELSCKNIKIRNVHKWRYGNNKHPNTPLHSATGWSICGTHRKGIFLEILMMLSNFEPKNHHLGHF